MANIKPLTHDGVTLSRTEWARRTGIPAATIQSRLNAGWDVARALTTHPTRRPSHADKRRAWQRVLLAEEIQAVVGQHHDPAQIQQLAQRCLD